MKRLFKNDEDKSSDISNLSLELCRTHGSVNAEAYLLERAGDWKGALVLLLKALTALFSDRQNTTRSTSISSVVCSAIDLCERLDGSDAEESWFSLLDLLVNIRSDQRERQRALNDVFAAMRLTVSTSRFVHQLETRYGHTSLGDFRAQLRAMSEDSRCTRRLLSDANRIASQDNGQKMRRLHVEKLEAMYIPPETFKKYWTRENRNGEYDDLTKDMRDVESVDMEVVMNRVLRKMSTH